MNKINFAQVNNDYLYDFEYKKIRISDDFDNTCLIDSYLENDTLHLEIFSQFDPFNPTCWIHLENDTVKINLGNQYLKNENVKYNSSTEKFDTMIMISVPNALIKKYGCFFTFKTYPEVHYKPIMLNDKLVLDCLDRTSYKIIDNDTVNFTDEFGMKQGVWLEYDLNGFLTNLDKYENDQILIRYKRGRTISKRDYKIGLQLTKDIEKRKYFKELLSAPEKFLKKE